MKVPFFNLTDQFKPIKCEIMEELDKIVTSCSFVGGPIVKQFEDEVAKFLGVRHAITCGNGTDALILALRAFGIGYGDEVITTSFSFFATAEAIAYVGATPVFVDICKEGFVIDASQIEKNITRRTKAIIPVQLFGGCCDMDEINRIAKKYGLYVIEDDAQAIGTSYKGRMAGSLADIGCFSFYPTKNLGGAGDGGMVTTNSDELAVILRSMKEHGAGRNGAAAFEFMNGTKVIEADADKNLGYDPYKYYNYLIGENSRLDSIQAAILSIKLRHLPEYNRRRAEIADAYSSRLTHEVHKPTYCESVNPSWHQYVIRTSEKDALCQYLSEHEVGYGTFYPVPLHKQKAFNTENSVNCNACLEEAESASRETVCLPVFPELTDENVQYVIDTVNSFFRRER